MRIYDAYVSQARRLPKKGRSETLRPGKYIIYIACSFATLPSLAQIITTFAGVGVTGSYALGDGGPATAAYCGYTVNGSFDSSGNYYFAQDLNAVRVRKITPFGVITTIAGNGTGGFSGDGGPATDAQIAYPFAKADKYGNLYVCDYYNNRLRKVDVSTGIIHTIAGNGTASSTGDGGPATAATIVPIDMCIDRYGNLYISNNDTGIRKIDTNGIITTVLPFNAYGMCFDPHGNLYLGIGVRVIKVNLFTGHIDTVGGKGGVTYNGDNIPEDSANFRVFDLALDAIGDIYIADGINFRIRMIDTSGIIHTIAGIGVNGYSGDGGRADSAEISDPEGIVFDACGNLFIADDNNGRIRKVSYPPNPSITISGVAAGIVGDTIAVTANVINAGYTYSIRWLNKGIPFATTTVPTVRYIKTQSIDSITAVIYGCSDSSVSGVHVVTNSKAGVPASKLENIIISPNPVINDLHINNLPQKATYQLHNIIGTTVAHGIFNAGNNILSLHELPPGLYMLEIVGEDGVREVRKVVKE